MSTGAFLKCLEVSELWIQFTQSSRYNLGEVQSSRYNLVNCGK